MFKCFLLLYCCVSCYCFIEEQVVHCRDNLNLNMWLIKKSTTSGRHRHAKIPEISSAGCVIERYRVNMEKNVKQYVIISNANLQYLLSSKICYIILICQHAHLQNSSRAVNPPIWLPWETAVSTDILSSQTLKIGNYRRVYLVWAVEIKKMELLQITNLKYNSKLKAPGNFGGWSLSEVCTRMIC